MSQEAKMATQILIGNVNVSLPEKGKNFCDWIVLSSLLVGKECFTIKVLISFILIRYWFLNVPTLYIF
jgi:hypothetical protein